jgi:streptogramin lyase
MKYRLLLMMLLAPVALAGRACDCSGVKDQDFPNCQDSDGDGYGPGCRLGPDCDDNDPSLNFSCDCDLVPHQGCPCQDGQELECFEADKKYLDVGVCRAGKRNCQDGKFSACLGQVLPSAETCNNLDDDCDGRRDEIAACSSCGPSCYQQTNGPDYGLPFDDQNMQGLELTPEGYLQLPDSQAVRLTFLYVANSDEGTVSKIDTTTGREVARYLSALCRSDPRNRGSASCSGNAPSRTAVDFNGDVWVANRAFGQQGTVTKIAHRDCPDLNQNGRIDTSSDVDGDGRISLANPQEYLGEDDECILFTVNVGGIDAIPRAIALDAGDIEFGGPGRAWVGTYNELRFYRLDPGDGHVQVQVDIGLHPYGAAIDSRGQLWATDVNTGTITSIDTGTLAVGPVIKLTDWSGSYGIAVDGRDRVWVGGYAQEGAARYNPADGSTLVVSTPGLGVGRGIAADAAGYIWLAHSWLTDGTRIGRLTRFRADDGSELRVYDFPADALETIGVGIDFDGRAWGVNRQTDNTCRVEPQSGQVECFPTGHGTYTYSDFTGFALRNFTAPRGTYKQIFQGCRQGATRWKQVAWEASTPAGTRIVVHLRAADEIPALAGAQRHGPYKQSPADLLGEKIFGYYLLVEVLLETDVENLSPILKALSVQWVCQET